MTHPLNSKDGKIRGTKQWLPDTIFPLICGLIVGIFMWLADTSSPLETVFSKADDYPYNLLVQGFNAGQLNLKEDAPAGLAKLSDPYDPNLNAPYMGGNIGDLTYYKGKLYLYFGVTPALALFWPYYALTGHFLSGRAANAFFMVAGFAAIAGVLRAMRRRYFPETGKWIPVAGTIMPGLALAMTLPVNVHETVITCGFGFAMLALAAIWAALHEPGRRVLWLALASLAYGLALGARPNLLFGAVILLLPVLQGWRQRAGEATRRVSGLLLAAAGPMAFVGLGLMLYNFLRFNNPFEFGLHYQLNSSCRLPSARLFSLDNFWFNARLYFLEPVSWSRQFPFLKSAPLPSLPTGYDPGTVNAGGSILIIYPIVFFIIGVPLAWKGKLRGTALGWFTTACLLLFAAGAVTLCLYFASADNYELEFLPGLLLLALIGTYCADHAALPFPRWRRLIFPGWFLLMGYSVAFNFLANVESRAENHYLLGNYFFSDGRPAEAKAQFQKALALFPECADGYLGLGDLHVNQGHLDEAIVDYQKALEFNPNSVEAQNNIGYCFFKLGRPDDAITHFETVVELRPRFINYRIALGNAYAKKGLWDQAIVQYKSAAEIEPDDAEAHKDLGNALSANGKFDDAISQYQKALAIQPGSADVHERLGDALFQKGDLEGAMIQYQTVVKLKPDFANAHNSLGYCYQQAGHEDEAIIQYQKAIELEPDFAQAYSNLGNAYRQKKLAAQAVASYQRASELAPQFVAPQLNLAWMLATWPDTGVRNGEKAVALAKRLNELAQGKNPEILRTLAAAYAEAGRFAEASSTAKQALELAEAESDAALTKAVQTELGLYLAHSPQRSTDGL